MLGGKKKNNITCSKISKGSLWYDSVCISHVIPVKRSNRSFISNISLSEPTTWKFNFLWWNPPKNLCRYFLIRSWTVQTQTAHLLPCLWSSLQVCGLHTGYIWIYQDISSWTLPEFIENEHVTLQIFGGQPKKFNALSFLKHIIMPSSWLFI